MDKRQESIAYGASGTVLRVIGWSDETVTIMLIITDAHTHQFTLARVEWDTIVGDLT